MSNITMQVEATSGISLATSESVLFDNIISSNGDISYDSTTGLFTINESGRYVINWWVATQSSISTNGAVFAINSSQGDFIEGNSPIKTGEVYGTAIIEVDTAPINLSLINNSTASVFFASSVPVKASLSLVQDDDVTPSGGSAIIPFASGTPSIVTSIAGGLVGTTSLVGFGNNVAGVNVLGNTIDLTGAAGTLLNFAFSVPRDGVITSLSAYFSVALGLSVLSTDITVRAQLYRSSVPDNTLVAIPSAFVDLAPTIGGIINVGDIAHGINSSINVPVSAGDRLLLVFSITAEGLTLANTLTGYASGGIEIS